MAFTPDETEDFITCGVCWLEYDQHQHQPKFLTCHHTVCLECLHGIFLDLSVTCPLCRKKTSCPDGPSSLLPNTYAIHMIKMKGKLPKRDEKLPVSDAQQIKQLKDHLKVVLMEELDHRNTMQTSLSKISEALKSVLRDVDRQQKDQESQTAELITMLEESNSCIPADENIPMKREQLRKLIFSREEQLAGLKQLTPAQHQDAGIKIRIDLRDPAGHSLRTCPLFERGFLREEHCQQFQTETRVISHLVFDILRRQNICLQPNAKVFQSPLEQPIVDGQQIETLRAELTELGEAQSAELAELAETFKFNLIASWDTDNRL